MADTAPGTKGSGRIKAILFYSLFLIVILFAAGEITVRLMGFRAWSPDIHTLHVEPGGSMFQADSLLGYRGKPGIFNVLLQDTLSFELQHNQEGFRFSDPTYPDSLSKRPQIWILGCSFTHGYGVGDQEHFPALLQRACPQFEIRNYGMSGYGTYQSSLLLDQLLRNHEPPAILILAYGGFHDQRNTSNRFWRKALSGSQAIERLKYPHLRYAENGTLENGFSELEYSEFPGMRISAFVHYLEMAYNRSEDQTLRSNEVTRGLIDRIQQKSKSKGIRFFLTGIYKHPETVRMLTYFKEKGVPVEDLSVDTDNPELRILPSDRHPNAKGHRLMADKLHFFLKNNGICDPLN